MTREEARILLEKTKPKDNSAISIMLREALDMAIKVLEKDIPKAPKKSDVPRCGMGYEYYDWYCPTCNTFLASECDTKRQYIHHCECGQRLDWRKAR